VSSNTIQRRENMAPTATLARSEGNFAHIVSLDGLRGIAIMLVVTGHYSSGRLPEGLITNIFSPFAVGGVILFFMLSGFLIERNLNRRLDIVSYSLRRLFRIIPAYWVSIFSLLVVSKIVPESQSYSAQEVLVNALLLQDVFKVTLMNAAFWTLLIEWKFYVAAPVVTRAGDAAVRTVPYVLMAMNAGVYWWRGEASNLLTYIIFCFVGMNFGPWRRGQQSTRAIILLVTFSALAMGVFAVYNRVGMVFFVLLNGGLLIAALSLKVSFFRNPILGFVGAVSYSWYLYHGGIGYPILAILESKAFGISPWVSVATAAFATLAMACASYWLIERSGIAIGRILEQRWASRHR
jgi:peptidoglycan/LPS O-acetylase OafA/YrhL